MMRIESNFLNRLSAGFMALLLLGAPLAHAQTIVALPDSSVALTTSKTTLAYSNFADAQKYTGAGWTVNSWGAPAPVSSASIVTGAGNVYDGNPAAQKFVVASVGNGAAHLIYPYTFQNGQTYQATVYMRADRPVSATVLLRHDSGYYDAFASATVTLTTAWTPVTVTGAYAHNDNGAGSLRVFPNSFGVPIYVGQMTLQEVQQNPLAPPVSGYAIPSAFFGMLVNKLGVHYNWPGLNTEVVRMWDTATTWADIEPQRNVWNFQRADMYVNYAQQNGAQVMLTLGQTPSWAASNPKATCTYAAGCSPPANITDWQLYVRTVAQRYGTRVKYWELWNEPDYSGFWNGTPVQLAQLAQAAYKEIKAVNPNAILIGPSVTSLNGPAFLDQFLATGVGGYMGAISFHAYFSNAPESLAPMIDGFRAVMAHHSLASTPLWNTEGAAVCGVENQSCVPPPDATDVITSAPRALFVMAAKELGNFDYYNWERQDPMAPISNLNYKTLTAAGTAYGQATSWIKGAQIMDAYAYKNVYAVKLSVAGKNKMILWATVDNTVVQLPSTWKYVTAQGLSGATAAIPASRQMTLTRNPLLLQ